MKFQYRALLGSALASFLIVGISITAIHESRELDNGYSSETERLNNLKSIVRKRTEEWNQTINDYQKNKFLSAKENEQILAEYKRSIANRREINAIINEETKSLRTRIDESRETSERSNWFILLDSGLTLLILWIGTFIVIRTMKSRLETTINLRKTSETLHKLIDSSPMGILVLDLDIKVKLWNPWCERIFGWSPEEIIGKKPPLFNEESPETTEQLVETMIQSRDKVDTQGSTRKKNGDIVLIEASGIPLLGRAERIEGYMFTLTDITEKSRIENELRKAKDEALSASKAKSDFLAGMSHEIRTPLNGIIGMTDLLLETKLDDQQKQYSKIVQDSSNSLLNIVNDILDFSKIEADKLELEQIDFSPLSLIESQAELMAPRAKEKNISLMSYVDPRIPWSLTGDPGRLSQIFLNLIGNSIKFTQKGTIIIRAELVATEKSPTKNVSKIRFSVTDTGIGLSPLVQRKIFMPFTQADGSTARKYGGSGLGLSICKNLVARMGGEIGVNSTANEGATFWFTLLLPISSETDRFTDRETGISNGKILILAKERNERELLTQYMNDWKLTADSCATPTVAIDKLLEAEAGECPFNVILVDKNLGEEDGYSFAKLVLSEPKISKTKMILLTNFEKGMRLENSQSEGFSGYVTKPIKQLTLLNVVQDALVRNRRELRGHGEISVTSIPIESHSENAKKILIAEDNEVNQLLTSKILKSLGYDSQIVTNGKLAVQAMQNTSYLLVLMDCHMPEMDGYEATLEIRKAEALSGIRTPIIALTASAMAQDRQRALDAGMDDHLAKPIKKDQLAQMVSRWTEKAKKAA